MLVAIIDYGSGNLRSAAKAFEHVASMDQSIVVTNDPTVLADASHIVLPGVGAFADCISGLEAIAGMRAMLETQVLQKCKPFLGICVGMQMLFETGYEHGKHKGLGWIEGEVVKIGATGNRQQAEVSRMPNVSCLMPLKIPHMGWNDLNLIAPAHPLLKNIQSGDHAYFVHSYHAVCKNNTQAIATTQYGTALTAIVAKDNIMGVQFHPEKSQQTGLQLIENFLKLRNV